MRAFGVIVIGENNTVVTFAIINYELAVFIAHRDLVAFIIFEHYVGIIFENKECLDILFLFAEVEVAILIHLYLHH